MPLIKAQCTNCSSVLEVDNSKDAAICPYCGTAYIIEKAIQNYNISIGNTSDNADNYLKNGITLLRFGDYSKARKVFNDMTTSCADDWRGWLGLSIASNENNAYNLLYEANIKQLAPSEVVFALGDMLVYNQEILERNYPNDDSYKRIEKQIDELKQHYEKSQDERKIDKAFSIVGWIIFAIIAYIVIKCFIDGEILAGIGVLILSCFIAWVLGGIFDLFGKITHRNSFKPIDEATYKYRYDSLQKDLENEKNRLDYRKKIQTSGKPLSYYIDILEKNS